eukprot:364861-Chlamydomonas_euryale.AAC.1
MAAAADASFDFDDWLCRVIKVGAAGALRKRLWHASRGRSSKYMPMHAAACLCVLPRMGCEALNACAVR